MILLERVREAARRRPASRALSAGDRALSYGTLQAEIDRRADALAGSRGLVALEAGDPIAFMTDFFAARLCGRGAVAHPPGAPAALRADREARLAAVRAPVDATIFYSSGSAGPGRAVPLTDANLAAAALAFESWGEMSGEDRVAIALSPAQILGFVRGALNALAVGAEAVFSPARRDPLAEAARAGATMALLPSALVPLAGRRREAAALRVLQCGGGAVDSAAADRVESERGVPVRAGYGMTESAGLGARQPLARPRRAGSVGLPAPGLSVEIVAEDGRRCGAGEPGEIRLSGAAVFPGFLFDDDPSPFDAEGRLRTGDVGLLDAGGELCVRGRLAFALTAGDRVVCAEEVEAVMAAHPAVVEAAAAPLDRAFGVLVVSRDASASALEELREHARRQLPAFARPRRIMAVTEIPRTASGKIDRPAATRWLQRARASA